MFNEECLEAFNTLKAKLVSAPMITAPDWGQEFELMCDASDYAVGVERNEDMGYVGVRELRWRWATGDGGFMRALWMRKACCAPSPDRHLVPHVMGTP